MSTDVTVRDNPELSRYEVYSGEELAGFAQYTVEGNRVSLTHTETDPEFAGRGLAGRLVGEALEDLRGKEREVLPYCPYVRKFLAKHPEYVDLVPQEERAGFGL
ncbi:N-acetyltransferase [Streptomyces sp. P38-E01]|uniref:N-acetyltransferase n=2 Tax=Streptomyces tardus TaxID=2780544 RepID=A0A949JM26_9ACTN|nr:GNAT family N-acetyltransferase [Streptomyces tardus]MBU7598689.1 N-acetyltransferase [Streptomyces tardus]